MAKHKWLKSEDFIEFSVHDRVGRITLNRPEKRNALTDQTRREIYEACLEADDRLDVSVVILEGRGKDFCVGADLAAVYDKYHSEEEGPRVEYRGSNDTFDNDAWTMEQNQRIQEITFQMHKPIIAKVHGNCLADGTDLMLGCDLIVAAEDARIGHPAARANGTPPNNQWLYHCGAQWAKRMLYTGDVLLGADAARIGLILDAVPADRLDDEVNELARRVACIDAEVLATHKRVINMGLEMQGARTLRRFALEMDVVAHRTNGPRRQQFRADIKEFGLKQALKNRDAAFGDSTIKVHNA